MLTLVELLSLNREERALVKGDHKDWGRNLGTDFITVKLEDFRVSDSRSQETDHFKRRASLECNIRVVWKNGMKGS